METRTKSSTFRILFLLRKTKLNKHGLGTITVRITIDGEAVDSVQNYLPTRHFGTRRQAECMPQEHLVVVAHLMLSESGTSNFSDWWA